MVKLIKFKEINWGEIEKNQVAINLIRLKVWTAQ